MDNSLMEKKHFILDIQMVVEHYLILFTKSYPPLKIPVSFFTYSLNRKQTGTGNTKINLGSRFVQILKRVMNCLSNHFGEVGG